MLAAASSQTERRQRGAEPMSIVLALIYSAGATWAKVAGGHR